jgi:hypothetical protein
VPKKIIPKFPSSWSYSAWSTHKQCGYKYYQGRILGIREPTNQYLERGNELHRLAEYYLKDKIKQLPPHFDRFKDMFKQLKKAKPVVEQFWGVNDLWKPVDFKSWCVMKMDAAVEPQYLDGWLNVIDFKTGREYDNHTNQGELYSCIGLAKYPKIKGVITEFWYLDSKEKKPYASVDYTTKYLKRRTNYWMNEGFKLLDTKQKFLPAPTEDNCKYCYFRSDHKDGKGTCEAWKTVKALRRYK